MSVYAAWIVDGLVVRVGIFPEDDIPDDLIIIGHENNVGIGFIYDGETFIDPRPQYNEEDYPAD